MATAVAEESIENEKLLSQPLTGPIEELSLLRQSLLFAEMARLAYYRDDQVRAAAAALGFEQADYYENDGAQAYILSHPYDCIVACRGTEADQWNDLKADVNLLSVLAESIGHVHCGFKREVDDLWPRLEEALKDNEKTLWFTGHSLGGAMATICAGRCKLSQIPSDPRGLFTFGSPRVGCGRYINYVELKHYRWVNNNDIVCRVPPPWMGYRHAGRELYLNAFGRLSKYRSWRRVRDRMLGLWLAIGKWEFDYLADHSMNRYVACIQQAVADEEAGRIRPVNK